VASTPTVSGGRVFVTGPAKEGGWKLECYAAGNGSLLFTRALPADALSAPVATEDRVFLGLAGGKVLAYDHKGKMVWEREEGALAAPWPEGPRLLVACGDESGRPGLRALDAATGERRDRGIATPSSPGNGNAPVPEPESGMFAGGGGAGGGGGIPRPVPPPAPAPSGEGPGGPKDRGPSPPAGPTPGPAAGGSGVGVAGPFGFEGPRPCAIASTAALASGSDLLVQGLEGGEARRIPLGAEAAGAPVAAKSVFVQATRDGRLLGFDPVSGARRFEVRLTSEGNPIPLASSPAVWRGRAYVGTQDGRLVVVDLPEPSADGWPMWGGSPRRAK
jgi:outer membrane protein assembly factor BamB